MNREPEPYQREFMAFIAAGVVAIGFVVVVGAWPRPLEEPQHSFPTEARSASVAHRIRITRPDYDALVMQGLDLPCVQREVQIDYGGWPMTLRFCELLDGGAPR